MYRYGCVDNAGAEVMGDPLVAQAHAEEWDLIEWGGRTHYRIDYLAGHAEISLVFRCSGTGRDDDVRRLELDNFRERNFVIVIHD